MREYKSLKVLLDGGVLNLEGINLRMKPGSIEPGDLYVAERNTGPQLLTCKDLHYVKWDDGTMRVSWINPTTTMDYPYDWWECVRVEEVR
jgi:hypothetical protein